jgi:hypothetical protein
MARDIAFHGRFNFDRLHCPSLAQSMVTKVSRRDALVPKASLADLLNLSQLPFNLLDARQARFELLGQRLHQLVLGDADRLVRVA